MTRDELLGMKIGDFLFWDGIRCKVTNVNKDLIELMFPMSARNAVIRFDDHANMEKLSRTQPESREA